MRSICSAVMLVLVTAPASFAQTSSVRVDRVEPTAVAEARPAPHKAADKKFWAVSAWLNTAMLMDTKSTFDVSKWCWDCREANPVVAPFVRQGAPTTYVAGEAFDIGVMMLAAKMKRSDRMWVHRTWWVIPVVIATGHTVAYRHNVTLPRY